MTALQQNHVRALACLAVVLVLAVTSQAAAEGPRAYRPHNVDDPEVHSLFRSGQVVVSEQGSAMSFLFTMSAAEYEPFVHAAILSVEHGRPYVYEAAGKAWVIRENPLDAVKGRVRRMDLATYVKGQKYMEIYDVPPGVDGNRVAEFARNQHRQGTPFDPYFDDRNRSALYCTELIAASLEAGGARNLRKARYRTNPSFLKVFDWLGIEAESVYLAGAFIVPDRFVAAFSNGVKVRTARVHFAINRELHRRFTPDQKLGNVFVWDDGKLTVRPELQAFRDAGVALFEDRAKNPPSQAEADTTIRDLARDMFGPIGGSAGHSVVRAYGN